MRDDTISRAKVEVMRKAKDKSEAHRMLVQLLPEQPESHTNMGCPCCCEDSDGYVNPLEKNCHAFIRFGMNVWEIDLKHKGWHGSAKIMYCPMCGRKLKREVGQE